MIGEWGAIVVARLRCLLRVHSWQRMRNAEGAGWYRQCRNCGKQGDLPGGPQGLGVSGF